MLNTRKIISGIVAVGVMSASLIGVSASAATSGNLNLSNNSLGNLLVLDALFSNGNKGIFSSNNSNSLGNLLILNQLFGNGSSGSIFSNPGSGQTSLGNLLILNQLFGNKNLNTSDLGRLFLYNQLFGGNTGATTNSSTSSSTGGS